MSNKNLTHLTSVSLARQPVPPTSDFFGKCTSVKVFEKLGRVGEGTYGVVYRARDSRTKDIVALKRLRMEQEADGFPLSALREIALLKHSKKGYSQAIVDEFKLYLKAVDASVESPQIHLLRKLIQAPETHDSEMFERLGAADLNTRRRIVESEIVLESRLDQYSQLLTFLGKQKETNETSSSIIDSTSSSIRGKWLVFMNMKIKRIINSKEKGMMAANIMNSHPIHDAPRIKITIRVLEFPKKRWLLQRSFNLIMGLLERVSQSIKMTLAQAYCKIGPKFHQDAVALYTRIIDREPDNIVALLGLSNADFIVQKYQKTRERLYKGVELDAANDSAISDIGLIEFQTSPAATAAGGSGCSVDGLEDCLALLQSALELNDCAVHNYRENQESLHTPTFSNPLNKIHSTLAPSQRLVYSVLVQTRIETAPKSIFSVYQSAQIKFKLRLLNDANTDFKSVKELFLNNKGGESGGEVSGFLVPCLKSMGECNLYAARVLLIRFFWNLHRPVERMDSCITVVTLISAAAELVDLGVLENGLRVLWCEVNDDDTEESETNNDDDSVTTPTAAAFQTLMKPAYLHDLAMAYHYLYNVTKQEKHLKCSLASLWKALQLDPENQELWNSLGCVVFHVNLKVAQHAFVKAVELNEKNAEAWTNLGYFYYFNENFDLAKQCFHRAQLIDFETCLSWYGQALINQSAASAAASTSNNGNKEPTAAAALDLFDHANDLSQGQNLEIGYSYALSEYQKYTSSLSFKALLEQDSTSANDAAGFTLLGLLREKQGVFGEAVAAFGKAVEICRKNGGRGGKEELEQCLANYSRALCSAGLYGESIEVYKELRRVSEGESLTLFQEALNILSGMKAPDVSLQNNVRLLLSQVLFALGADVHLGLAKEQLLACLQRGVSFPQALISLLALGIVSQNDELAQEAAAELIKEKPDTMMIGGLEADKNMLLSRYFLLQGGSKLSRGFLARSIHQAPWKATNWLLLADNISRYAPEIQESLVTVATSASLLQHSKTWYIVIFNFEPSTCVYSKNTRTCLVDCDLQFLLLHQRNNKEVHKISTLMLPLCCSQQFIGSVHVALVGGWGLHARTMEDADKLLEPDNVDASTRGTEVVCNNAASLLGSTALDISWSNLPIPDFDVEKMWQELDEAYADSNLWQQSVVSLMQALSNCHTVSSQAIVLTQLYLIQENREEATAALEQLKSLDVAGSGASDLGLLQCVSMMKFGNAGALNKTKRVVAVVMEKDGECEWALWLSNEFNLR
ncbi:hypothetical protein BDR26DRAFT_952822 [Obelidium mucronatum]|nr:hypothetical protein BDR26DRAFT_952822 [Obelidium mucronatum]